MTEETKIPHEKKHDEKIHQHKHEEKTETKEEKATEEKKHEEHRHEHKTETKTAEKKTETPEIKKEHHIEIKDNEDKKEKSQEEQKKEDIEKKKEKQQTKIIKDKKEKAIAHGVSLPVSKKQCMYICSFIKNNTIDKAISELEQVIKFKKSIPFKGEIPHRKGKTTMAGRYPIKASKLFIKLLKGLRGNALVNNFDLEKTKIVKGIANWASRPLRGEGRKAKRTNVLLEAREFGGNE